MALRQIVTVKDTDSAVLLQQAVRVRDFGPSLHQLLDDMLETMREAPGVGLAAPQIGIGQRIAVIEYPEDEDDPENTRRVYEIINPEIIKKKGSDIGQEGCLSIPGLAADVERATQVVVKAQDRNGKEIRIKAYDWLARIFQHEIDQRAFQLCAQTGIDRESASGDFSSADEVQHPVCIGDIQMIFSFKIKFTGFTFVPDHLVQGFIFSHRDSRMRDVWNGEEPVFHFFVHVVQFCLNCLDFFRHFCHFAKFL